VECDAEHLDPLLRALLSDESRLQEMSRSARAIARPDAAAGLADFVEECARA
jgi:UDP-N-acetylglucosamine:LPS N-acetylglucosamine transferase